MRIRTMAWTSPFSLPGRWLKGNLHTHTTQSDGGLTPEDAVAWYRDHGYELLAITDHWVHTPASRYATDGITLISGAELHGPGYHMLAVGLNALPDRALADDPSSLAAAVRAAGGLPFIAHPYWTGQTSASVAAIAGIEGIEVYNAVCDLSRGLGYSNVHWDELLATGHRLNGLAVDDVHWRFGSEGRGFVMVRSVEATEAAVLEALAKGHYYASTGPVIHDLTIEHLPDGTPTLRVRCSPCQSITFHAEGPKGRRHQATDGRALDTAVHPIQAEQVYLRVECHDGYGKVAWSNPIFVEDVL
jgi:hypothetical protein